ncbi:hypothetical protein Nepgr_006170 [Nepenthes gracilis]|uniref:Uncharacterized protein n=1 Tax=Nepenthes gracilis TaxID=150966 RepID=A0AAD3S4P7_NEPGR|nr:hypothetical protein Nepgr_006170 [Nepenthes gracilis]
MSMADGPIFGLIVKVVEDDVDHEGPAGEGCLADLGVHVDLEEADLVALVAEDLPEVVDDEDHEGLVGQRGLADLVAEDLPEVVDDEDHEGLAGQGEPGDRDPVDREPAGQGEPGDREPAAREEVGQGEPGDREPADLEEVDPVALVAEDLPEDISQPVKVVEDDEDHDEDHEGLAGQGGPADREAADLEGHEDLEEADLADPVALVEEDLPEVVDDRGRGVSFFYG